MKERMKKFGRRLVSPRGWGYGLFWSWNIIFLAFMFLGFAPQVLPEVVTAVRGGVIPGQFLVYAVILTAIPAVAVVLGLTVLRREPGRLLTLGYGVEGPLMLLLVLRFFVVREATPAVVVLLSIAGLGVATLVWQLLDRKIDARRTGLAYVGAIGLTLLLVTGLYAGTWIAFYAVPLAAQSWEILSSFVRDIGDITRGMEWRFVPLFVLGTILAIYSATLFVAMPVAVPLMYVRAWWRGLRSLAQRQGWGRAAALTAIALAVCAGAFVGANRQPQHRAFALLETRPATVDEAQALLDQQEAIRAGLLNAYLAPWRYISAVGEVRHVSAMYESALDMQPERAAEVQRLYEAVARPLLYAPVEPSTPETSGRGNQRAFREEPAKAAKLYKTFFDRPIVEGEREAIVHAARSTWSLDQAQAAWLAVDDREVHLARQEVTISERGDWAEVELYEVYQNQTGQRQEVVYYFSLPESAVITGLWLGNSADRAERFAYRVAPRGAAQAVYRNEVNYNVDPALIEQIGPRQYRLRVFPVEPQTMRWEEGERRSTVREGPPVHVWMTWRVLARDEAWALPRLAERRNVYWDGASVRLVNGEEMTVDEEDWLPRSVPATEPMERIAHRVDFPGGKSVVARPVEPGELSEVPGGLRLAAVLDRSRSMVDHKVDVRAALERLAEVGEAGGRTDVYLTASEYRGEEPVRVALAELDAGGIVYYGGQNAAELLAQFDALRDGDAYDAILVLTDGTGYELGGGEIAVPIPDAPVWMVHLGGDFSLGYDDATLEAIQASGGGVAGGVEEALGRLAAGLAGGAGGAAVDVIDGYAWSVVSTETAEAGIESDEALAALAARRLIISEMQREQGALDSPDRLETLDRMHAVAVEQGIVTPYSSMIVLVNERQEKLLDDLEERGDRFEREYEAVGETVPENALQVTGVPEPEEWLLLAVAAGMLVWYAWGRGLGVRRRWGQSFRKWPARWFG